MSGFQIIMAALAGMTLFMISLYWHEYREHRLSEERLKEQLRADRIALDRYFRETRHDSKIWRQRLSLAIARISEVVDTPPEEKE